MGVAAIVLAAGGSSRMGEPKQLVVLDGETLLDRSVRVAREAGCSPVVVVLGSRAGEIQAQCELGNAVVVLNADWASGMAGSIRVGVRALTGETTAAIVMTCDQPAVDAAHLQKLIVAGSGAAEMVASQYGGRRGVPAFFPDTHFAELLSLEGDLGARHLLAPARFVELALGELDVDTPLALLEARSRFE